jgi:phospholipase/lecithinase/hemolysin
VTTTTAVSSPPPSNAVTYWFPFGDSYTTTGFVPSSTLPTVGNPLGNPPFPGFTGGGGENFVGFDTVTFNKSTILTYNYAYGGATINGTLVAPFEPTVLSLIDQVNEFLAGAGKKPATSPWTSANSLFTIWIGINDLGNSFSNSGDRSAFSDLLLTEYFAQVQKLYAVGARNFLFINVPPMERSPLMIAAQNAAGLALLKSVILTYNSKLAAKVASFKANNTGVSRYTYPSRVCVLRVRFPAGYDVAVGRKHRIQHDPQ